MRPAIVSLFQRLVRPSVYSQRMPKPKTRRARLVGAVLAKKLLKARVLRVDDLRTRRWRRVLAALVDADERNLSRAVARHLLAASLGTREEHLTEEQLDEAHAEFRLLEIERRARKEARPIEALVEREIDRDTAMLQRMMATGDFSEIARQPGGR
jgi:hypothetical protein